MNFFTNLLIIFIKLYKLVISPYLGNNCRYLPTCSDYFIECLKTYGFFKGFLKGSKRILTCRPGGGYGFDPIKNNKIKK